VKECILVHFSQRNISKFPSQFCAPSPPKALLLIFLFTNCILQCNASVVIVLGTLEMFSDECNDDDDEVNV